MGRSLASRYGRIQLFTQLNFAPGIVAFERRPMTSGFEPLVISEEDIADIRRMTADHKLLRRNLMFFSIELQK